jgi:hypothetical protein
MSDDTLDEIDFIAEQQHAEETLNDSDYRRRDRAADFVNYSEKQQEALNSTATALYLKAANQTGKTSAGAEMVRRVACNAYPADHTGWRQPKLDPCAPIVVLFGA